jgi:prepilin-type N-terminal cleavage/methylation domain-containing protein
MTRGITLVELLVVLVLVGMLVGMSALAMGRIRGPGLDPDESAARIGAARAEAIRAGRPIVLQGDSSGPALFLPDGRVLARDLDPLTGAHSDAW